MLSTEINEKLTQVGKGTPMGELMRQYWHPIGAAVDLQEKPTKPVRILGEDLVLYKDGSGKIGLIERYCPHRRVDLSYGIPEQSGLRCMYHGWQFNEYGQCIEQPFEETVRPDGRFKEKVQIASYPVEELGGLLWAYLGPSPAPLLPRWDLFVWDGVLKDIGTTILPCNWLQCMENSLDPVHLEWLHVYWGNYQLKDAGFDRELPTTVHTKIKFDQFEHGIIKRRTYTNTTEDDPEWTIGHPIIFPNWLRVGTGFQMRVPIDDTHTMHVHYNVYAPPKGVEAPKQDSIPHYEVPLRDEEGKFPVDFTIGQDQMAWVTQGAIAKRELEKLGESDRGIILYRKMLVDEMDKVANGMEPLNVFRDPNKNQIIELFQEHDPAIRMTPPREPLPGMIDPITGDISAAPTGRHAPVGLKARSIYKKAALDKGILI
ncbi:MAG: (2Fe-2S)-binding protein [Chloroflexi bacterium]|nr:(2Fe-2S)-binding protein [Chloroflexota bacterium]|tara:strand:+ start:12598 stop:13884 length:1287 start_codon:yes stop_codon:yes gene_type:complete